MVQCISTDEFPKFEYISDAPDVVPVHCVYSCHIIRVYADKGGFATWQINTFAKDGLKACVGMIEKKFPPSDIFTYVGSESEEEKRAMVWKLIKDSYDA